MTTLQWNREFALEQTADDEELLDELIVLFKDSAASDFSKLQSAAANNDMDGILAAAHSLKGASASLGIEGIRALAMDIEEAARENTLENTMDKVAQMSALLDLLQKL